MFKLPLQRRSVVAAPASYYTGEAGDGTGETSKPGRRGRQLQPAPAGALDVSCTPGGTPFQIHSSCEPLQHPVGEGPPPGKGDEARHLQHPRPPQGSSAGPSWRRRSPPSAGRHRRRDVRATEEQAGAWKPRGHRHEDDVGSRGRTLTGGGVPAASCPLNGAGTACGLLLPPQFLSVSAGDVNLCSPVFAKA